MVFAISYDHGKTKNTKKISLSDWFSLVQWEAYWFLLIQIQRLKQSNNQIWTLKNINQKKIEVETKNERKISEKTQKFELKKTSYFLQNETRKVVEQLKV